MIQSSDSSRLYVGNNSTVTAYPVPFLFYEDADLIVVVRDLAGVETKQTLGTHYTVAGKGNPNGGSITTTFPVPVTSHVSIVRQIPMTQLTSYEEGDSFPAKSHEAALDRGIMIDQQLSRALGVGGGGSTDLGSAFRLTEASGGITAVSRKNDSTLGIDEGGSPVLRSPAEMIAWMGEVSASGELVLTDEPQTLLNKTLISPTIITPAGLTPADVQLGNVQNTSDADKPVSTAQAAADALKQNLSEKALANGYASLDGTGKIPPAQLPASVGGGLIYQGTWNATTNTPTIPSAAVGNTGWQYIVSVAGTTNIGGISSWAIGDQLISSGSAWQKVTAGAASVLSVNTRTGAVVLTSADVGLGNVSNTSDATRNSAAATLTNKTIDGAANTLTVRLGNDVSGNLPVARLNGGTGASNLSYWRGDGTWAEPAGLAPLAGQVVQTIYAELLTEQLISTQTTAPFTSSKGVQFIAAAITPVYANSKILIRGQGQFSQWLSPVIGSSASFWLIWSGLTTSLVAKSIGSYGDGVAMEWMLEYMHAPGAGTWTYSMRATNLTAAGHTSSLYINDYQYVSTSFKPTTTFVLQEIKQ